MGLLGRLIFGVGAAPQMSAPASRLQQALAGAAADVARDFPQCTARERREMIAMRRMELFRHAARELSFDHPYRKTWFLIAHIWWITGLVLQRRRAEAKREMLEERWAFAEGLPLVLDWIRRKQPFKDELAADVAAAELWALQGHPTHDRPS